MRCLYAKQASQERGESQKEKKKKEERVMTSRKSKIAIEKETERPTSEMVWSREHPSMYDVLARFRELRAPKYELRDEGCISQ